GRVGKVDNCQNGIFAVYASARGQAFLTTQLYLPQDWFDRAHAKRWKQCGIPPATQFRTEPAIALDLLRELIEHGQVPFRWVAADEDFGRNQAFLDGVAAYGKWYLVEVPKNTRAWLRTPRVEPPGPSLLGKRARLHARVVRSAPAPQLVEELAAQVPRAQWRRGLIQEGGKGPLWAEFAWLRVTRVCDQLPGPRNWLMVRRNLSRDRELKYYLSNAPASYPQVELMRLAGWRWPIETAFEEGKGEVGLDHYETRSWLGWHHHMQQSFMAHLFLVHLQQVLKKESRPYPEPGPTDHSPRHRQRNQRQSGHSRLHRLSPEAQSPGLSFSPQADATSFAI
ncbi:MAG: IS701 family transposase, partial [Burkholderiales bacterium]